MKKSTVAFFTLAATTWLCISLCLKIIRYSENRESRQVRTERDVNSFMASTGWHFTRPIPITADGRYTGKTYMLPDCHTTVMVTVIGLGEESVEVVRRVMGSDIAFLQNGSLSDKPQLGALAWNAMLASGLHALGGAADNLPSVVAIAPSPKTGDDRCSGPSPAQWSAFHSLETETGK